MAADDADEQVREAMMLDTVHQGTAKIGINCYVLVTNIVESLFQLI